MAEHTMTSRLACLPLAMVLMAATGAHAAGEFRLLPAAREGAPALTPAAAPPAMPSAPLPANRLLPSPVASASPAGASAHGNRLVPFEQPVSAMTLAGEDDVAMLTFHLSAAQRAGDGVLQIGYSNAVSVLPDTAVFDVAVNGKPAGTFAIRSPNGVTVESLPISASNLKEGRNEVRLQARQHHRVDCSLNATYELWTRLDPGTSGFLAAAPVAFTSPEDLAAIGRTADGVTEIRLVGAQTLTATALADAAPVIQALALLLDRRDIVVRTAATPGTGAGIDLYVGSGREETLTTEARDVLSSAPTGLSVRPGATGGRATVVMRAATRSEMTGDLLRAVKDTMRAGLDSGVRAAKWGVVAGEASKTFTLRDAGYVTSPFAGRLARTHFDLTMPADFYPAEYDTVDLSLDGATAPGLADGAQLLVRVNDRVVTSYPFRSKDGEEFRHKRIEMPLRAFRPGVNRIELLAEVPVAADHACQPQARNDDKPRFMLLDTSEIEIPALARIGRLPDLGAFAGTGYPFSDGKPFAIFIDRAEARPVSAALTALARMALAAGKPMLAEFRFSPPADTDPRNALVVVSSPGGVVPLKTDLPAADPVAIPAQSSSSPSGPDPITTSAVDAVAGGNSGDAQALIEAFQASTAVTDDSRSFSARAKGWIATTSARFSRWLKYEDPSSDALSTRDAGALVTLSQIEAPSGEGAWTIIRADSVETLDAGMARLADPAVWSRLEGGSVSIRADSGRMVAAAPEHRFVTEVTDSSFANARRLAAAWFSDNFQIYILGVILLMAGFGAWLGLSVSSKGVRTDQ